MPAATLSTPSRLDDATLAAVRGLIDHVTAEDGRAPLSDQALTQLTSDSVEHLIASVDGVVAGYAQLDGRSLEIAADRSTVGLLVDTFARRDVLIWSHGTSSRLRDALAAHGFVPRRELHQLRRPLTAPVPTPDLPDGVDLRPFVIGRDEDAWLAINAAAFAHHPEQGGWGRNDILAREDESWFDPAGFLMAWRGDELLGFHWTKVHPHGAGEVYVIAVSPAAQGLGLGKSLLARGLEYLRERGCPSVLLYVDGDNTGAMRLYERNGFTRHDLDEQWAPAQSSDGTVSNT